MTKHSYNVENGPLWCVRLICEPKNSPCPMPELKSSFPHQYKLIFGFHHSITDGSSSMRVCSHFINILNDVISEKAINDQIQLAYFANEEQTNKMIMNAGLKMALHPWEYKKYKEITRYHPSELLFFQAFPSPKNPLKRMTLSLENDLGREYTSKFLNQCKKEGVTFHSAFCTLANASIIDMLVKRGIDRKSYLIQNYHTINLRRYWKDNQLPEKGFGTQFGKLSINSTCEQNIFKNFWEYAREFSSTLKFSLEDEAPMKEAIVAILAKPRGKSMQSFLEEEGIPNPYYMTTNMGNLNNIFTQHGKK